jgi:cell division protein FtsB
MIPNCANNMSTMSKKLFRQRPLLNLPQILILLAVLAGLIIALDLNRRAQAGRAVGSGEDALQAEVNLEMTRQVQLQATLSYVQSDDYIEAYARDEGGYVLSGEKRVVILPVAAAPEPTPAPTPTPDPAHDAQPWQAWWQLLTDAPLPRR